MGKIPPDIQEILDKVQQTIKESNNLLQELELRVAETDRFLEEHGLTREQVLAIQFTPEDVKMINAELERQGLPQFDEQELLHPEEILDEVPVETPAEVLENRQAKMKKMTKGIRL